MQKRVIAVLLLFASITLPMVATPAWAAGGHVATFAQTYSALGAGFIATSVRQTTDGGLIVAGFTYSSTGSRTWLLRLDDTGAVVWEKAYGTFAVLNSAIVVPRIVETPDGGFVVASNTNISSSIVAVSVFKVDSSGATVIWQQAFTGLENATAHSIDVTSDGGVIVAGSTAVGDIETPGVPSSALVLKLNSTTGSLIWQKTLANTITNSVQQTSNGGYVLAGLSQGFASVLRLDSLGNVLWQNGYIGSAAALFSIRQISDGGFVAAGQVSTAPFVSLVLRLDARGALVWQKSYGNGTIAYSVGQTTDGGFIVSGADGLDTSSPKALVLRLDSFGSIMWQRTFSLESGTFASALSVQQTADGSFVIAGFAFTTTPFAAAVVIRLNSEGEIHGCKVVSKSSLVSSTVSIPATSLTSTAQGTIETPITTAFTSTGTSTTSTVLCGHRH